MGVEYALQGELFVAYSSIGEGPLDVVNVPNWLTDVESMTDVPYLGGQFNRLRTFSRFVWYDQLGTGHSDPLFGEMPSLETFAETIGVVMDGAGIERAALLAWDLATAAAVMFAATNPDRVSALVVVGGTARWLADDEYQGILPETLPMVIQWLVGNWGRPEYGAFLAPSMADDVAACEVVARWTRHAASPGMVRRVYDMTLSVDVRPLLPMVACPTLVMGSNRALAGASVPQLEYLAEHIPNGRLELYDSEDHLPYHPAHMEWLNDTIEEFLTGRRSEYELDDRVLATVLFTDLVSSTETASRLGDIHWVRRLDGIEAAAAQEIERHRGTLVKTTGDGILATFDGPARAIRCARALCEVARRQGLELRAGVHTGEIAVRGDDIGGVAVHIAARVMALAGAGEVLVTSTVKDLVAGSGIEFEDRGRHELKGVPDEWQLLRVVRA